MPILPKRSNSKDRTQYDRNTVVVIYHPERSIILIGLLQIYLRTRFSLIRTVIKSLLSLNLFGCKQFPNFHRQRLACHLEVLPLSNLSITHVQCP